jgi:hypothetical protein
MSGHLDNHPTIRVIPTSPHLSPWTQSGTTAR